MEKLKKVMKYLMQIKVECFAVTYGVKVKNITEMHSDKKFKEDNKYQKQEFLVITNNMVSKQSRKTRNWKAPGRDFWIKKLTNLHKGTAFQVKKCFNGNEQLADWFTYGRTVLCQKDRNKW